MLSIGDFARHGQVSVRMLRHYDAIGLLTPAYVDPATGYRSYRADQLARLNRVVALKELGFTLEQVRQLLDEKVGAEALRGMLTLRRAELRNQIEADAARLAHVEARLRMIESEGRMPADDVIVKSLPAVRVAELSAPADSFHPDAITPVIRPLYDQLCAALERAGVTPVGPATAYYEQSPDGVVVHATLPVNVESNDAYEFTVTDLPAVERAATVVHRGPMDDVLATHDTLATWLEAGGHRTTGNSREVNLACPEDPAGWVTELQEPLQKEDAGD
ncbi:MAG: MerR family transcriptional regulator [Micromonosporaceae bacterium]